MAGKRPGFGNALENLMRSTLTALAVALGLVVLQLPHAHEAAAQVYPSRPVTMIVPAAAGGPTDTVARLVADSMSRTLGQQVVVENIGGAGGTIGMARVSKAAPDGYTLAVWHVAQATAPALYDNLKYHVVDDFDPLGRITDVPMTVVGKPGLEPDKIGDLVTWLKAKGSAVTYGHAGIGSASHLCALMMMSAIGYQMTPLAYRGTGPAMNDLLGGQFDVMCDQTTNTTNQINAGKIKAYAATTPERLKILPNLPTMQEAGFKGFEASAWHAVYGPKGLPADVTQKIVAALQAALKDETVIKRFADLGTEPVSLDKATPEAHKAYLKAEVDKWTGIIKAAGVKGN
jgi:tripartite-type tricarboxylate transporter receptor subunit TctC